MGLRPARIDRGVDKRPYTRTAKRVHKKNFIKGVPGIKVNKFNMGQTSGKFELTFSLVPSKEVQIRHNALEALRVSANSYMRKIAGTEYHIKVRVYPHNILREHAQAAVAQADRFYDGMRKPFGKPTGRAARLKEDQPILTIRTNKKYEDAAKEAIRRAGMKIPVGFKTVAE
ncbi:MAG: 50S ribosomal protein L16 [Candidatus Aenigmarchaeota archaeon]|nr:50S ribosomal protein L16 [Candidatus Aenigmarchaeota archaeon]